MTDLALKIEQTIQGLDLPLKLDSITDGDGNCFSRAVVQQCQREVFKEELMSKNRYTKDYTILKKEVVNFAKGSKIAILAEMKRRYEALRGRGGENESWDKYWERMMIDKEWVDNMFVQATAWYLNRDIWMISDMATDKHPWMTISGNYLSPDVPCPGVPLLLGYNNGLHYQSLLPTEESRGQPQASHWCSLDEIVSATIREKVKVTEKESEVRQDRPVTPTKRKSDAHYTQEAVKILIHEVENVNLGNAEVQVEHQDKLQHLETEKNKLQMIKPSKRTEAEKKKFKTLTEQVSRFKKAQEVQNKAKEDHRKKKAQLRATQTEETKNKERERDKKGKAQTRVTQTEVEKNKERGRNKTAMAQSRANKYKKSDLKGWCAHNLQGVSIIQELKDTKDSIGDMEIRCKSCQALKWKGETPITCCNGGKVKLEPFPTPPELLQALWVEGTREAQLFRKYSRSFANALSLSSIKVNERKFVGGFTPNIIFEGKVMQISGPLQADKEEIPVFSQLYVHDPQLELTQRIDNMHLPKNLPKQDIGIIRSIMKKLQELLKQINPYVKDFIHICEIPETELMEMKLVISAEARPAGEHERRYNKQDSLTEVSILTNSHPHDLVLRKRGGGLTFVSDLNPSAQPLHFTLVFPWGTKGWDRGATHANGSTKRITTREFFCFHIQVRNKNTDYIPKMGRLLQEYLCYAQVTNENQKLNYLRMEQKSLRADKYKNIAAAVQEKDKMLPDDHNLKVGRKVLPSSFHGGPRWFHSKFLDGMAIVREFRKPDLFITLTCNPNWQEIGDALGCGENVQDRPDLVARVFKLKKDQLLDDIIKEGILGKVVAYCWVIEWQKRGLPHMHLLVILANNHRISTNEQVDCIISAELPQDPDVVEGSKRDEAKRLQSIVVTNMIHGPCGNMNPTSVCMKDKKCTKNYPKSFCKKTFVDPDNSHPEYRRRSPAEGGRTMKVTRGGKEYPVDNSMVVPYSPYLSLRYNCHINMEVCLSPTAAKYLFKYIQKGEDRTMVKTTYPQGEGGRDEIEDYVDLRSMGSSEAAWHLLAFPISKNFPAVVPLRIHLEDEQQVCFDEGNEEIAIAVERKTELMGFFDLNKELIKNGKRDKFVTYVDCPKKFRWDMKDKDKKKWIPRVNNVGTIGRVHSVHPTAEEVFFLRILLHHVHCKGKTSFKDLMTINGEKEPRSSYQEVCMELGLLQDDSEWDQVLTDGAATKLCQALRELFTYILLFCEPADPKKLFEKHFMEWIEDIQARALKNVACRKHLSKQQLRTLVLLDMEQRLQSREKELATYKLPKPSEQEVSDVEEFQSKLEVLIWEELDFNIDDMRNLVEDREGRFTDGQRDAYNTILEAVKANIPLCLFLDARGGCGKTYTLNAVLAAVRILEPEGCVALAMATTGIAANLLLLGRTFHSRMKAPLTPVEDSMLAIPGQGTLTKLLKRARILLIDEATMLHRYNLEAMDRTLRDILDDPRPFGGKVVVLTGDFRQTLPVVPRASRAGIVDCCINRSHLWKLFRVMKLSVNMRVSASGDPELHKFDEWVLSLGNGTAPTLKDNDQVEIDEDLCHKIESNTEEDNEAEIMSMKRFTEMVFPNVKEKIADYKWLDGRAILAPTNKKVDELNDLVTESLPGDPIMLYSSDFLDNEGDIFRFSIEYMNTLNPAGLPRHQICLKPGMPLMLMRNLCPQKGLCNGTRLIFQQLQGNKLLQCIISGGEYGGRTVFIPRITLYPKEGKYVFGWSRRQFPVRTAFAITINKVN